MNQTNNILFSILIELFALNIGVMGVGLSLNGILRLLKKDKKDRSE